MSEDRNIEPGERRLERIRSERGMPVRRAPIAAGALLGGAAGAWVSGAPAALLDVVRDALAAASATPITDGPAELRALLGSVAAIAWPALAGGAVGAVAGALAQTGFRWRWTTGGWRMRVPTAAEVGGAPVRIGWAAALVAAASGAVLWHWQGISILPALPLDRAVAGAARVVADAVVAALVAGAAFATADVAVARWRWARAARMTDEEAREERRQVEGNPESRSRRRDAARRLAGMARGRELRGLAR